MIHVAILLPQFIDLILSGRKTVEARLTVQARAPFEQIEPGERIYFKQSAGPYRAAAVCEHVIFESGLSSKRIREIKRDYNEWVCGPDDFWKAKRDSQFATLIWLAEVQPCSDGPRIPPLQGAAWKVLDEDPVWRRIDQPDTRQLQQRLIPADGLSNRGSTFSVEITPGNLRNNSLYVTAVIDNFPADCLGGANRSERGRPITLLLRDGPTVETDIVAPRRLIRARIWGKWFKRHGAKPGDQVVFTPADDRTFFVGLAPQPQ